MPLPLKLKVAIMSKPSGFNASISFFCLILFASVGVGEIGQLLFLQNFVGEESRHAFFQHLGQCRGNLVCDGQKLNVQARRRQTVNSFVQGRTNKCVGAQMNFQLIVFRKPIVDLGTVSPALTS